MMDETGRWAGRLVVAVFGGAFVLAVVVLAAQAWGRVVEWWKEARW